MKDILLEKGPAWTIWYPDFEVEQIEIDGQDWPLIRVDKFERNRRGERRFVESRMVDVNREEARQAEPIA